VSIPFPLAQRYTNESSLISYPLSIINVFVSAGLVWVYMNRKTRFPFWKPGIRATLPVTVFFMLSNMYLVVAPYVPPEGKGVYKHLPYYLHCVVALGLFGCGALYYLVWTILMPWLGRYMLVKETVMDSDGWSRSVFTRMPVESEHS
jgi:hypothetical protein